MKKDKKTLLPLSVLLPLLMSNSPVVYPDIESYKDVVVTCVHDDTYVPSSESYHGDKYSFTIENQGNRYPILESWLITLDGDLALYEIEGKLFSNEVVPPSETKTYSVIARASQSLDGKNEGWEFEALSLEDENVTFSEYTISEGKSSDSENTYFYDVFANVEGLGDYEYNVVVDVTYKDVPYAFEMEIYGDQRRLGTVVATEKLDLSEMTINSIKAYRSTDNRYNWWEETVKGFQKRFSDPSFLLWFIVSVSLFLAVVIAIALPSYLVFVKHIKEQHKK